MTKKDAKALAGPMRRIFGPMSLGAMTALRVTKWLNWGLKSKQWGHGGGGAPNGEEWVWEKEDGYAPGDPDAPDGRLFSAPFKLAEQICDEHNAFLDLLEALETLVPDEPPTGMRSTESTRIVCLVGELHRARAAIAKARGDK